MPEETRGVLGVVKGKTEDKGDFFGLRILQERVPISCPGGSERIRAILAEKLFQNFLQAKFAEYILFQKFPISGD